MKKLIVTLLLVLAIVFFGAPYYTGKVAETETMNMIEKMNQSSLEYGSVEVVSYERGLRSTNAQYKYTPPTALMALVKDFGEIKYSCESTHGMTSIDYTCQLEGESTYSTFVTEHLNNKDPLSVYGTVSVFGGITQTISLDAIKDLDVDGTKLNFPKAEFSVATNANMSEFNITGGSDAFNMENNGEKLSVGEITIRADLTQIEGSLFTGDVNIKLDNFSMTNAIGETKISDMLVTSKSIEKGDNIDSKVLVSIKKITVPADVFDSIEDLNFSLDFLGLDKQAAIDYQTFANRMQKNALLSLENNNQPDVGAAQMAELMPILERLLKEGLELDTTLNAKLNGEPNSIGLNMKLLETTSIAQLTLFVTNPEAALQKIDLTLAASLNKELVDSQPMAASFIAQSPLVMTNSDDYALNLKLGKKIELNNKTMNFAELQTLVLSSLPL